MGTLQDLLNGRAVLTLAGSASALDAARAMTVGHVGSILVVDGERRPLGIFTERDLMTRVIVAGLEPARTQLDQVMTRELLLARSEDAIEAARLAMQTHHVRHLPIVDPEGRALAMLSLRDVLRFGLEEREHEVEVLHDYISHPDGPAASPAPKPSDY